MRDALTDFRYKTYPIGSRGVWQRGSVLNLLKATPILWYDIFLHQTLPQFEELNALLKTGSYDAGMSGACEWTPFSLTQEEYDEICLDLATQPTHNPTAPATPRRR